MTTTTTDTKSTTTKNKRKTPIAVTEEIERMLIELKVQEEPARVIEELLGISTPTQWKIAKKHEKEITSRRDQIKRERVEAYLKAKAEEESK